MFNIGQKVVCVDDVFLDEVKKTYMSLPVKDKVYVVRGIVDGQSVNCLVLDYRCSPEPTVYLIGLNNPTNSKGIEHGFSCNRFRSLDELKNKNTETKETEVEEELEYV